MSDAIKPVYTTSATVTCGRNGRNHVDVQLEVEGA